MKVIEVVDLEAQTNKKCTDISDLSLESLLKGYCLLREEVDQNSNVAYLKDSDCKEYLSAIMSKLGYRKLPKELEQILKPVNMKKLKYSTEEIWQRFKTTLNILLELESTKVDHFT